MSSEAPLQDRPRQEPETLQPGTVVLIVGGIVVMLVLVALATHLLLQLSGPTRNSPRSLQIARSTRLASDPEDERAAFERAKTQQLHSYGWLDPQHHLAHIPIERAMQKLAEHNAATPSQP